MCDRVGLIQDGELFGIDTPAGIRATFKHPLWRVAGGSMFPMLKALRQFEHTLSVHAFGDSVHLCTKNAAVTAEDIVLYLDQHGLPGLQVAPQAAGIEDVFMGFSNPQHHG